MSGGLACLEKRKEIGTRNLQVRRTSSTTSNEYLVTSAIGHGALWVDEPEKYGLSNGIVAEFDHPHKDDMGEPKFFIVSKLHEVHCLVSFFLSQEFLRLDQEC